MLKPIGVNTNRFKADTHTKKANGEYKDPLMKWPLRGCAFTNEVGEALRPLIGGYATLSWAPALLYIGADIYDKYKNDQNEYSPDSRRCLKQAIFQGLASVLLPLVAVKAGQNIFSQFGKYSEDKISLNSKEHISKLAENFIANGKMRAFNGRDEECVKEFKNIVTDSLEFNHKKKSIKNFIKVFHRDKEENVSKYAEKTITELINLRKSLLTPDDPNVKYMRDPIYMKWSSKYHKYLSKGQTKNVAIKSTLTDFQKGKMLKGNFIKTLGGFVALGLAIKPIDNFVEHVLIGKYVGPKIDSYKNK